LQKKATPLKLDTQPMQKKGLEEAYKLMGIS
jgi:hypothetical protein